MLKRQVKSSSENYYAHARAEVLKYIPLDCKTFIDAGCSSGAFGSMLQHERSAEVWGLEYNVEAAQLAQKRLHKVFAGDMMQTISKLPNNYFDAAIFNDSLEHLTNPEVAIQLIKEKLKLGGSGLIISSIPNMRHFKVLKKLLYDKDWCYQEEGVMDKTHLRWFTSKSIKRFFTENGFDILQHEGIHKTKSSRPFLLNLRSLGGFSKDVYYQQFVTVAKLQN